MIIVFKALSIIIYTWFGQMDEVRSFLSYL